jgi:hypothetical protein
MLYFLLRKAQAKLLVPLEIPQSLMACLASSRILGRGQLAGKY